MAYRIIILAAGVASMLTQQVWAADTLLGSYGNTELQQNTGDAVQTTCKGFVDSGANADEIALFATCRSMVQTAVALEDPSVSPPFSLGLSQTQLADSLQQIATEEFGATETMASDISSSRMDPVITRLVELRAGARGFSVTGLLPGDASEALAASGVSNSAASLGGAAGDGLGSRLGGFFNASYGTGDKDGTDRTNSFDFDSYNITAGLDYRIGDDLVVGGAFNYYNIDSDFDETPEVAGGSTDAKGWGASFFGTWYKDNFYIDALAGYASSDYDTNRNIFIPSNNPTVSAIVETATASPESDDYTVGVGAGYNFNHDALNWGPYFRATYIKVGIEDYREKGAETSGLNLDVNGQDWKSMTTVLGAQLSYTFNQDFGVLVPYARAGWTHQFENDATDMTAVYVDDPRGNVLRAWTDEPDEDYAEVGVGVSAVFKGGLQAFFNYDTILELEDLTTHLFTVGVRMEL
ncbi:MAG: autotransporter outer membrane beta-barrel domain-containing protein [Halioglobus sp.]